jgi:hypothetical protein
MAGTVSPIEAKGGPAAQPAGGSPYLTPPVWQDPREVVPPEAGGLFLVGTVHGDPVGYARVRRLLERVRPLAVTVEISSFSVCYRERHGSCWRRLLEAALAGLPPEVRGHLAVRRLAATVALPFEWQAAADFGRDRQVPVFPVDLSAPARRHLPAYARELLTPENLRSLAALPDGSLTAWAAGEYHRARLSARRPLLWPPGDGLAELQRREAGMARRLRELYRRHPRLVHLGGWEHLAPRRPEGTLFDRLADLSPRRWLLEDVGPAAARPGP